MRALLEHAVLVDAGLVGEGVLADDGLVALHLDAGDVRHQPARRAQAACVLMLVSSVEVILARPHGHDDFFEGAVAGPFAEAVDGAFDLAGAFLEGGQAVGDGQAQVVVAMDADDDLVDAADVFASGGEWRRRTARARRSRPCREC